ECVTFQHQLNLVRGVMQRLEGRAPTLPDTRDPQTLLAAACSDKLRVLGEGLLDVLLYLVYEIGPVPRLPVSLYQMFDQRVCEQLFHCLCVREDTRMQLAACTLLVRMCGLQPWWGDFLANTLARLFSSQHSAIFPQDRVFILLTYLGRKSLGSGAPRSVVLDSVLAMLARLLSPLATPRSGFLRADMDLALISWVLLFLSVCFDTNSMSTTGPEEVSDKPKDKEQSFATRWDFIQGEVAMQKKYNSTSRSNASRSYRRKLQKRLMHHKQQLEDLEVAKKAFHASTQHLNSLRQVLSATETTRLENAVPFRLPPLTPANTTNVSFPPPPPPNFIKPMLLPALTALSNQAANLSSKLEAALKQQEQFYRKTLKQHSSKVSVVHLSDEV
ncbi:unnamed protein product, partial [Timema podura]|nr:unnamed protein product [Timema podura]